MKELLAKYKEVAKDIDTDKELTAEQKLGFYITIYRSLIDDVERNEDFHLFLTLTLFLAGLMLGVVLR